MCGIAGIAGATDRKLVKKMCDLFAYRGPDHFGHFDDAGISLGSRRLSIIGRRGGNQPIFNESGDVVIVYNGEIYNHLELRKELEKLGHKFKTQTDTESIIHGYEEYGFEIANKLRGMFAFALFDSRKKILFIARDKFGKKPLYYTFADGIFHFASELKSLMLASGFDKTLDKSAVDEFLAMRFIASPKTIFLNTKKLPPASYLIWKDGKIKISKYFELEYNPSSHSENYYSKKLLGLLSEAVRIRLMSEVPLGAYLSGGLDSSSVVALMSKELAQPVKTFSVGFGVEKYDELPFAKEMADEFSTSHRELIVSPNSIKHLPKIIWHLDEPMADPTAIPTYLLSGFAKKHVTVVLTGEGGDEMFAGYEQYKMMKLAYSYGNKIPRSVRRHLMVPTVKIIPKRILDGIFKYSSSLGKKGMDRFSDFFSDLSNPARSYLDLVQIFSQKEREELYGDGGIIANDLSKKYAPYFDNNLNKKANGKSEPGLVSNMQLFDIATNLPEDLLMKVDKMTMAHSIEARCPLLDSNLAELAFQIPSEMLLSGMDEKHILRRAMQGVLPSKVLKRKKARFYVPLDYWFGGDLLSFSQDLLLKADNPLLDKSAIRKIISNYSDSKTYSARQLWNLICLQLWQSVVLDKENVKIGL